MAGVFGAQLEHRRAGNIVNQIEALLQRRAAFLVVFVLGCDAQRLAEISTGWADGSDPRRSPFRIPDGKWEQERITGCV